MPQSLAQILLHITFSTKNREPFIQPDFESELYTSMATICNNMGCNAHLIGGISNHVHIAGNLSRTVAVCDLLEDVKKYSSKWIKTKGKIYRNFAWQAGYGAFSLGMSQLETVKKYIGRQKEHHRKRTFQEEYLELLNN